MDTDAQAVALLREALSGPLALEQRRAQLLEQVLARPSITGRDVLEVLGGPRPQALVSGGGVAVVPLHGFILQRGPAWVERFGVRTVERFLEDFELTIADDGITTVVLHVDSPGGSVSFVPEAAERMLAARGKKRVIAVCDPLMASAAYWLGSTADEIVVTPSGLIGSIGVIAVHFDWSAYLEGEGVKPTIVTHGRFKSEGTPLEPLTPEGKAHLQQIVDDMGDAFDAAVAIHRGVSAEEGAAAFGEGRVFTAARAVAMGLADRAATLDDVLEGLGVRRRHGAAEAVAERVVAATVPSLFDSLDPAAEFVHPSPAATWTVMPIPTRTTVEPAALETESIDADGDAPTTELSPPDPTGPVAQEPAMDVEETGTEPQAGVGAPQQTEQQLLAAERERVQLIDDTCDLHGELVSAEQRRHWISSGASVQSVQRAIVAAAKAAAAPVVTAPQAAEERSAPAIIRRRSSSREEEPGFGMGMALLAAAKECHANKVEGRPMKAADWLAAGGYPDIAAAMRSDRHDAGGAWVPENYMAGEFIEMLRPESAIRRLNPRFVPLTGGNASISKLTGGATAYYHGEAGQATTSEGTSGRVNLVSKKLTTFVPVSFDLLRRASPDAGMIVRDDSLAAVAERSDLAFIRGDGSEHTPKGLKSLAAAANKFNANATVNLDNVTSDMGTARLKLAEANVKFRRPGWVFAPRTEHYLMTVRDGNGNYAFRQEMLDGTFWGYPYATTTQIPVNLGGGSDESEVYLADFAELLLGEEENFRVDVFDQVTYWDGSQWVSSAQNDEVVIRIIAEHDFDTRHDEAIAVIEQVTWGA